MGYKSRTSQAWDLCDMLEDLDCVLGDKVRERCTDPSLYDNDGNLVYTDMALGFDLIDYAAYTDMFCHACSIYSLDCECDKCVVWHLEKAIAEMPDDYDEEYEED